MIKEIATGEFQEDKIDELYLQAVRNNSIPQIKWCIKNGANIHYLDDMALDTASTFQHLSILKFLTNDIGLDLKKQYRCLFDACKHNDIEMIKFIVEDCGMDVAINENRPIANAVMTDSLEAFLYLKEKGALINLTENKGLRNVGEPDFKVSFLANNAWFFNSTDCMREILPSNKKIFFSNKNILYCLNAASVLSKIKNNSSLVNYVMGELMDYSPKKFELFISTRDSKNKNKIDSLNSEQKEQFDNWLQWFKLEKKLPEKENKSRFIKI